MIQIFVADGTDGRDQPKVVQEVLADLKIVLISMINDFDCHILNSVLRDLKENGLI